MFLIHMYIALQIYAYHECIEYKPDWDDLDNRPLPQWYDDAKIGIFIHWGLYSVPAFYSEWFWHKWVHDNPEVVQFVNKNKIISYESFVSNFTCEYFDPDEWAELFFKAGAKYVVLTSKHHDGFALFPSSGNFGWNTVESGPREDLVDLLSKSVRNYSMKFGVYYSLLEWYSKDYPMKVNTEVQLNGIKYVENIILPDIKKIIINYKPSVLWTDGDWGEFNYGSWRAEEILAWIYNEKSVKDEIVVNDRWGKELRSNHGDFYSGLNDKYNPRKLIFHKFENAFPLDVNSWGYVRDMDVMDFTVLLETVVTTVSCGGNVLINVGPMKEGIIPPVFRLRLMQLGEWLKVNGEAIYGTSPWFYQQDSVNPDVWYTCKKKTYDPTRVSDVPSSSDEILAVYVIFLKWPKNGSLIFKIFEYPNNTHFHPNMKYKMYLLKPGNPNIEMKLVDFIIFEDSVILVRLPPTVNSTIFQAWVLKVINILS